jgi:DNA repair protein RecO (recombination protein O)
LASFTAAQVRIRITSLPIFWSKTNSQFRAAVGKNPSPDWPVGSEASLGEDMVEQVASRPGAAGYVELNFAALDSLQERDVDSACVERTLLSAAFDPDLALILLTPDVRQLPNIYNHLVPQLRIMALMESEAIVLRTYPLREADLLVTLFTRAEGKVRGVARSAKKSKRRFGGALEPMTYVRAFYDVRERQELARLDACEVIESPMATEVSYARAVALAHVAELLDELLPDREANDAIFRLTLSVLHALQHVDSAATIKTDSEIKAGSEKMGSEKTPSDMKTSVDKKTGSDIWMPVTYFELWLTRLVGFLPELTECIACGRPLNGSRAWFHALADGLMCPDDKRLASSEISGESRALAAQMFRAPVETFAGTPWSKSQAADLRKFLVQTLQRHIEKKLVTAGMLDKGGF